MSAVTHGNFESFENTKKLNRMPDRAEGRVIGNHVHWQKNWFQKSVAVNKPLGIK